MLKQIGIFALSTFVLSACANQPAASVDYRGTQPGQQITAPSTPPQPVASVQRSQPTFQPANQRLASMSGYDAIIAQEGETLESIALLTGVNVMTLSELNDLSPTRRLRAGDRVLLPGNWSIQTASVPAPAQTRSTPIQAAPLDAPTTAATPRNQVRSVVDTDISSTLERVNTAFKSTSTSASHTVLAGETVFSISRRYGVTVDQIALQNNLSRYYEISVGQVLQIPIGGQAVASLTPPTQGRVATPVPPSASAPLPIQPQKAPQLDSPQLSKAARKDTGNQFLRPVEGKITRTYKSDGSNNEGITISTESNNSVVSANDGEVALVSQSVGGLGTVILIQHKDNWNTVYGRITNPQVQKGQRVSRGQVIGYVAPTSATQDASLHFEIRKGTKSVDPAPLL